MKKIFLFALSLLMSLTIVAQDKTPAEKARIKANRFAKEWELEHRQRDNVYAVYLAQERQLTEIALLEDTDKDAYRAQRKVILREAEQKLMLSLDKYQRREYESLKTGKKKKKRRKRKRRRW